MNESAVLQEKLKLMADDVAETKADIKRLDAKIDSVSAALTEHRLETQKGFAALRVEMRDLMEAFRRDRRNGNCAMIGTIIAAASVALAVANGLHPYPRRQPRKQQLLESSSKTVIARHTFGKHQGG